MDAKEPLELFLDGLGPSSFFKFFTDLRLHPILQVSPVSRLGPLPGRSEEILDRNPVTRSGHRVELSFASRVKLEQSPTTSVYVHRIAIHPGPWISTRMISETRALWSELVRKIVKARR